ncbi:TnsA endonuclease N-terminal domain-containing protein [Chromobacterium sp. ASV23]|uniref:TnsA endonuclease N-terminal domain-containing protein n=1 Tax=Chromobacterium sp. ASV23 TaxID=2795110 RepID=UPI0018EE40F2|nr:TnsA endonuclease N-terminal domain-containing protein [Chromobacterium sp. ASV23]
MTLFITMLPHIDDLREQFPLSLKTAQHEINEYDPKANLAGLPGTQDIASNLGYKHPKVTGEGKGHSAPWVMSTDFLLTLKHADRTPELLAIAYKKTKELNKPRTKELLAIEQAYWQARKIQWLLITPEQFDKRIGLTLRRAAPWALGEQVPQNLLLKIADIVKAQPEQSLTSTLQSLCAVTGEMDLAQRALWQAVCLGYLPIDLTRCWRPHLPLRNLTQSAFLAQNPIAMRRSAWI